MTVKQTTDGGYVIGGSSESTGVLGKDMCLIKTNSLGDTMFAKTYGGSLIDECYEVIQTNDGGYILCGRSFSFTASADYDVYVVKTNSLGILQWSKTYGSTGTASATDIAYSIDQTNDGGYIIAGETATLGAGFKNVYLIKTDSLGNSGCNESIPATVSSDFHPQVIAAPTLTSVGGILSFPATQVNSGSSSTNICLSNDIADTHSDFAATIFPNPFSSIVSLSFNIGNEKLISISIIDVTGRIAKSILTNNLSSGNNSIDLDLSELKNGMYFCKINSDKNSQTIKLLKNQ